ncbi:TPA: lecithin retinol acyltransferase family protein, partial [Aeromonas hydrophila]
MTRHFIIGDHLVTPQPEGHHHGIFVGHDQVIHCLPTPAGDHSGQLALTSLAEFSLH